MKRILLAASFGLAALSFTGPQADAAILFTDTFDGRTTGSGDPNGMPAGTDNGFSDWGTSSDGQINYIAGPNRTGGRNQVVGVNPDEPALGGRGFLFTGGASADLGTLLSSSPDGFTVGFDFDRIVGSPSGRQNGYLNFGIGMPDPLASNAGSTLSASFGVFFQQESGTNEANATVRVAGATVEDNDYQIGPNPADFLNEAEYTQHSILVTLTPQVSGAYGDGDVIDYTVDYDSQVDFFAGSFTSNGNDLNTFGFSANNGAFAASVDNLQFSSITAVPEPGSLAVLGLVGLVGGARARRLRKKA